METKNFWGTTSPIANGDWLYPLPDFKEVVILGAGGAGLSTAAALGFRGFKEALVIDALLPAWKGARKGIGTATLSARPVHHLLENNVNIVDAVRLLRMSCIGIRNVNDFIQRFWPDKDWCRKLNYGGFHIALSMSDEDRLADATRYYKLGEVQASLMNAGAIKSLTGINNPYKGIFVPNELTVNPAKYFNGMITQVRKMGIDIMSGFCVSEIYQDGLYWVLGDELGNNMRCRRLILCTGANLAALPSLDEVEDVVIRRRITYGVTPTINGRLPPYIISSFDGSEVYRRYENRIVVALDTRDTSGADMKPPEKSSIQRGLNRLDTLFNLGDSEKTFEYIWAKNILETKDSLPIVSEVPTLKNLYLNIGYNHHGLPLQMIGGTVMAELLLGSNKTSGVELFSLERFGQNNARF